MGTTSKPNSQQDQSFEVFTAAYTITDGPGTVLVLMTPVTDSTLEDAAAGAEETTTTTTTSVSHTSSQPSSPSSTPQISRPTAPATPSLSPPQSQSQPLTPSDLSPSAKAGLAIGITLAVLSLAASLAAIWLLLHRHGLNIRARLSQAFVSSNSSSSSGGISNKKSQPKEPFVRRVRERKPAAYSFLPRKVPRDRAAELHSECRPQELRTGRWSPAELQAF